MDLKTVSEWIRQQHLDRLAFEIELAQKAVVFWEGVEKERRENLMGLPAHILHPYIRAAKQRKKEARDRLKQWQRELTNPLLKTIGEPSTAPDHL